MTMNPIPAAPLAIEEKPPMVTEAALMGAIWAGLAIACFFTSIRYLIRYTYFRRFFVDDALVLAALTFLTVSAILYHFTVPIMYMISRVRSGLQPPPPDILPQSSRYMKLQFAIITLFWTCLWSVKLAFLAFFYKLGSGLRYQRIMWHLVLAVTLIAYVGCVVSYPISCPSFQADHCDSQLNIQRSQVSLRYSTAVDVITDGLIIGLPINLIWKVRMNIREKLALGVIFSFGGVIMIFAIARVCLLLRPHHHPELSWLALWSSIESSVAVIVSCLASFKTLFTRPEPITSPYRTGPRRCAVMPDRCRRGPPLNNQFHHLVEVRAGPPSHHPSIHRPSSETNVSPQPQKPGRVHVQTDVEVCNFAR